MAAGKLKALSVIRLGPGNHGDGNGLYLRVTGKSRTWGFRFKQNKKPHWIGLGPVSLYTLAEAREKSQDCRRRLREGVDLMAQTRLARSATPVAAVKTFREVAALCIEAKKAAWKSSKHGAQWQATLEQHAGLLMPMPVSAVGRVEVWEVLNAIWLEKPETASRLRGRIETVLNYATARQWRTGENPARWKGHLDALLAARSKVKAVVHHPALPWRDMPAVMARLASSRGTGAICLAFTILTAARSMEARGATWAEIDISGRVWTIPASRMKAKQEHRVHLTPASLAILEEMLPLRRSADDLVFPGQRAGRPLSDVAVSKALHVAARRQDVTVHGCRSTLHVWASEETATPREVIEAALAHTNTNKVEAAYARSTLFAKRVKLLKAWGQFCTAPSALAASGT